MKILRLRRKTSAAKEKSVRYVKDNKIKIFPKSLNPPGNEKTFHPTTGENLSSARAIYDKKDNKFTN